MNQNSYLVRIEQRYKACRLESSEEQPPKLTHVITDLTHTFLVPVAQVQFALHFSCDTNLPCTCFPLDLIDKIRVETLFTEPIYFRVNGNVHTRNARD
jgi:hypothetical protein